MPHIEQGADALEVDVRFCGSGELIIFHDLKLKNMFRKKGWIWSTTLKELRELSFYDVPNGSKYFVPTVQEFIEHFKGRIPINLDAKVFTPVAGQFAKYLVRLIKQSGHRNQFWVSSFNPIFLRTVKVCGMDIRTGYLFEHFDWIRRYSESWWNIDDWHPELGMVNNNFMNLARKKKKNVYVWTVNHPNDILRFKLYENIKGIITDNPSLTARLLEKK